MEEGSLPPAFVLVPTCMIDNLCGFLYVCKDWRDYLPFHSEWLSKRVGNVSDLFPKLLTYRGYLEETGSTRYSLESLYAYAFKTPSTALGDVTTPTAMFVLLLLALLFRAIKAIFMPIFCNMGRRAGRVTHGVAWEKSNEVRIQKFGEYILRLLYHTIISIYGVWYFWDKEWWDESKGGTKTLFVGYPYHEILPGMTWYYLVQSAYNMEALVSLLELSFTVRLQSPLYKDDNNRQKLRSPVILDWSDTVRGDFREMLVHHVVTNLLVIGSSFMRFTRVGSMVFVVHDVSDVPVDLSKLANFLKWKISTASCFAIMVFLWCLCRLTILPFVIYKSVLYESILVLKEHGGVVDRIFWVVFHPIFSFLVGLIILLHAAWFAMFLRMGYILVFRGEAHDLTEHKNGEPQLHTNGDAKVASNGKKQD